MPSTWTAPDGSLWPLTGYWCPTCHMPITETAVGVLGVHPCCININAPTTVTTETQHITR